MVIIQEHFQNDWVFVDPLMDAMMMNLLTIMVRLEKSLTESALPVLITIFGRVKLQSRR